MSRPVKLTDIQTLSKTIESKPRKPQKFIEQKQETSFYDWDYTNCYGRDKQISLNVLLIWIKNNLPKNAKNIKLRIDEDWEYDDCITNLIVCWTEKVANPKYQQQMKKYLRLTSK